MRCVLCCIRVVLCILEARAAHQVDDNMDRAKGPALWKSGWSWLTAHLIMFQVGPRDHILYSGLGLSPCKMQHPGQSNI